VEVIKQTHSGNKNPNSGERQFEIPFALQP